MRLTLLAFILAFTALSAVPAEAQRRQPTPEQRIDRLERGLRQVQSRVFPRGQPADTAGTVDEPAATLTQANQLSARLDAIEQQMTQIIRTSEDNHNRVSTMEAELARLRADLDGRLRAVETGGGVAAGPPVDGDQAPSADSADELAPPPAPRPKVETSANRSVPVPAANPGDANFVAAGEEAYDRGFQLWNTGRYDEAITALRAMASSFPGHRRVSWANNLAGRALLDKGQPRAAAEAQLAHYRSDPKGERAADSLCYLGQALMRLGQASQACKAYAELEEVYGSTMRAQLRQLLPSAKLEARCS